MNALQQTCAILAFLAGFCIAVVIGGIGVAHKFGFVTYDMTMGVLQNYGTMIPAAAGALAILALLLAAIRRKGAGVFTAIVALCFAGAAAYLPLTMQAQAQSLPRLNDVSTDTEDPPAFVALAQQHVLLGQPLDYDASKAAAQRSGYPDIQTVTRQESPAALHAKALAAVKELGWVVEGGAADSRIEATATSEWFGFREDIVVRVTADGEGSKMDVRSASRQGEIDYGANADNIRALIAKIK